MAYRLFFSGLVFFVRCPQYKHVDALLLNPCAVPGHDHGGTGHAHAGQTHDHAEATCPDHHFPQMTVRRADLAEWQLPGVVHGCGWHHFDLTGKTLFPKSDDRQITLPQPEFDELDVDPVGRMRHVPYKDGVVDMAEVLKGTGANPGRIDGARVSKLLGDIGKDLIAARVRLPKGSLTSLALLDNSPKRAARWTIGNQNLSVLGEVVMFESDPKADNRLEFDGGQGSVTLRNKANVTVWISCEPLQAHRSAAPHVAEHFDHYYDLLPGGKPTALSFLQSSKVPPRPQLNFPQNTGDPLCPECEGECEPPGLP